MPIACLLAGFFDMGTDEGMGRGRETAACLLARPPHPLIPRPGAGDLFEAGEPTRTHGEGVGRK